MGIGKSIAGEVHRVTVPFQNLQSTLSKEREPFQTENQVVGIIMTKCSVKIPHTRLKSMVYYDQKEAW